MDTQILLRTRKSSDYADGGRGAVSVGDAVVAFVDVDCAVDNHMLIRVVEY